jgi:tetratricopeptide (TPR) repeat protein
MNYKENRFVLLLFFFSFVSVVAATDVQYKSKMLSAYANMQYLTARKIAAKHPDSPESRLILAFCAVFDRIKQDLGYGLTELKNIYVDKSINSKLRLQAGLAYARAAQTLQMRHGVYQIADGIDYNVIYNSIKNTYPNSPEACFAVVYQAQSLFDLGTKENMSKGIAVLEKFLIRYKGAKKFLAAINILLADQYIIISGNYHKAVKYLIGAFECGISNPRSCEIILFRIARTYDLKLGDKKSAQKYYNQFIEKYPNSSSTSVVKRYLCEMGGKK